MAVSDNYQNVKSQIVEAAQQCGRDPREITLVAVSKGYPWEHVQPLYQAGCRDFGESHVQDALQKMSGANSDIRWHFIGTLQKNKVNKVIGHFFLIHSVDSLELAQKISSSSQEKEVTTPILLQVNTSGESTKHGLTVEEWRRAFEIVIQLPAIRVEGLMTMAPFVQDEATIRRCFERLRKFKEELSLQHLSMGMSNDYKLAIAEGATILRIGSALMRK